MTHIVEAMDKAKLGLAMTPMADSPAKRRMAAVLAGQAVVASPHPWHAPARSRFHLPPRQCACAA